MIGVSNVGERSAVLLRSTRYCSPEQSVRTSAEAQFCSRKARLSAAVAARQGESEIASMGGTSDRAEDERPQKFVKREPADYCKTVTAPARTPCTNSLHRLRTRP